MKIETMSSLPPNSNVFNHDLSNMGLVAGLATNPLIPVSLFSTESVSRIMIMHSNFADQICPFIIIVNEKTGERLKITFKE